MRVERDQRGRVVDPREIFRRGQLTIGLRLLAERRRDEAAGKQHRRLNKRELRCLQAALGAEIAAS